MGGRLLDDKYTSTHMAGNYKIRSIPMCPMTPAVADCLRRRSKDQMTECLQMSRKKDLRICIWYLRQRQILHREQQMKRRDMKRRHSLDRAYMPVNNTKSDATPFNNWSNLTEDDQKDYNDRIARVGGQEGKSNTRLYSYSGQNVIVAKFAVEIQGSRGTDLGRRYGVQ